MHLQAFHKPSESDQHCAAVLRGFSIRWPQSRVLLWAKPSVGSSGGLTEKVQLTVGDRIELPTFQLDPVAAPLTAAQSEASPFTTFLSGLQKPSLPLNQ